MDHRIVSSDNVEWTELVDDSIHQQFMWPMCYLSCSRNIGNLFHRVMIMGCFNRARNLSALVRL